MPRKRQASQKVKPWSALQQVEINPGLLEQLADAGDDNLPSEAWINDSYQVIVRYRPDGFTHLSVHRHDRRTVRDWRHLQAIKNEVCGLDRWAVEVFPPEHLLVDTSNEYHLFVYPEGAAPPFMWGHGWAVSSHGTTNESRVQGRSKIRQRPWQPGLPTGLGLLDVLTNPEARRVIHDARALTDAAFREHEERRGRR